MIPETSEGPGWGESKACRNIAGRSLNMVRYITIKSPLSQHGNGLEPGVKVLMVFTPVLGQSPFHMYLCRVPWLH